jgi:hypothetical protein
MASGAEGIPKAGVRKRLAEDLEADYEAIRDNLLTAAKGATKEIWVSCEKCSKRTPARVPDFGNSVKAAQLLLDQGFGRVAPNTGECERSITAGSIEELSDEQLEQIVNGELTVAILDEDVSA